MVGCSVVVGGHRLGRVALPGRVTVLDWLLGRSAGVAESLAG